ncbi:MAG TPA: sialate O-acetylesterase, partial [Cyclobacteriaceae bacterium]|nr:sialate O-acetylesterase [Cyclobacteriaceae bacterium]
MIGFFKKTLLLVGFIAAFSLQGQIRLPKLVSDGMVLQREAATNIWGWAAPGEKVTISFLGASYLATADDKGKWKISLPQLKAGGPFEMKLSASNEIIIHDI